jgi:hypothetical protein
MKINYKQLSTLVFFVLLSIYLMFLISCSAKFHERKFIQKGGKIEQTEKNITVTDTLRINGKDSIIYRQVSVKCPELQAPLTRWQTKIEYKYRYKTIRDSFETIRYIVKQDRKQSRTEAKTNKRKGFAYNFRFLGIIAFLILLIVLLFKFK